MTIAECSNRYDEAIDGLQEELSRILADMEVQFVAWQTERLFFGQYPDGSEIEPEYTDYTIEIKQMKGQPYDRVTLLDTGDFYGRIFAKMDGEELVIDSEDWKSEHLKGKYGENIFGLRDEDKEASQEMTADGMCAYVKEVVGL